MLDPSSPVIDPQPRTLAAADAAVVRSAVRPAYSEVSARKRLGLIVLSSDLTTEPDYARLLPRDQVACYTTRVQSQNPTTPENLLKMLPRLRAAAALFPEDHAPAAICYSCTAASVLMGDEAVTQAIQEAWPGVPVVTPSHSAALALRALGARRISILTPYLPETSVPVTAYFTQQGFTVLRSECLGIEDDRLMARVTPDSIFAAACALDHPDSDAVFISCTALPAVQVIDRVEQQLGKPVVTSNQATLWAMLRQAGITAQPQGYGQLFNNRAGENSDEK
ncbi:MAG: aspartate/glutamate racemase family protein [Thiolinea sp.]